MHRREGNAGTQSGLVDVVPETSTENLRVKKNNQVILSVTIKVISLSAICGVPGVPLLHPHGVNHLFKK